MSLDAAIAQSGSVEPSQVDPQKVTGRARAHLPCTRDISISPRRSEWEISISRPSWEPAAVWSGGAGAARGQLRCQASSGATRVQDPP